MPAMVATNAFCISKISVDNVIIKCYNIADDK
jgi:hypothetical protein